uniref:Uncharacterized protein n=1 Tax=Nelumbo nucifera TaxID=4432 RepID=A0A822ZPT6_NELNU|nr:TPA_asm: hypothetical protein HUJ06_003599 [Nelumbo nucifera]
MAKLSSCFFLVLLVFSVASMMPSSDAADGANDYSCVRLHPTTEVCNPRGCIYWCATQLGGRGMCQDAHNCACVVC